MIEISEEKLDNFIKIIRAIIDSDDEEIKNYALIALIEDLNELKIKRN